MNKVEKKIANQLRTQLETMKLREKELIDSNEALTVQVDRLNRRLEDERSIASHNAEKIALEVKLLVEKSEGYKSVYEAERKRGEKARHEADDRSGTQREIIEGLLKTVTDVHEVVVAARFEEETTLAALGRVRVLCRQAVSKEVVEAVFPNRKLPDWMYLALGFPAVAGLYYLASTMLGTRGSAAAPGAAPAAAPAEPPTQAGP